MLASGIVRAAALPFTVLLEACEGAAVLDGAVLDVEEIIAEEENVKKESVKMYSSVCCLFVVNLSSS
jgi:hypothetical protein